MTTIHYYNRNDRLTLALIRSNQIFTYPDHGIIVNRATNRRIGFTDPYGYRRIDIKFRGKRHILLIHRIIYLAWHGKIPNGYTIDHINRDRSDNRIQNLRCVTVKENNQNRNSPNNRKR